MITQRLLSEELTKNAAELAQRVTGEAPLIVRNRLSPEAMGQQIRALKFGPDMVHIVNVPNNGSVPTPSSTGAENLTMRIRASYN